MSIWSLDFGKLTELTLIDKNFEVKINKISMLRSKTFESMMQQECGWFDEEDNSSAVLASRLTTDAGSWQNVCMPSIYDFLMNTMTHLLEISVDWLTTRLDSTSNFNIFV